MKSLWIEENKNELNLKQLSQNEKTEICIIGGGMFGLTTAYYLSKQEKNIIVLEKGNIGEKVSGNTTGKITSQHGLFYNYLIENNGIDYAKKYLEANEQAIKNIEKIIEEEKIGCNLYTQNAYVYTTQKDEVQEIEKEIKAVNLLDKKAEFVKKIPLPLETQGAIKFENQAQFNPMKYMLGLAKVINNKNKIYNYTTVLDISKKGQEYEIHTDRGDVIAKHVVVATHYPIINMPGFYFTKMYQSTSYIIAIETKEKLPDGMYINIKEPIYSFRKAMYKNKEVLLIAGSGHKTGEAIEDETNYNKLEEKARELYPDCKILFKWNTRDCISLDKIPYIGEFSNIMPNVYVGTGFNKWGMTTSNIAAQIVCDKILGKTNKYEKVFDATRLHPIKNRWEVGNMIKETVNSIALNKFKIEEKNTKSIENDNGAIIKINGENVGIYKNKQGKVYAIKPNCSHLGCLLTWNNLDKTWDCPCHGSRFDYTGKNIYEPAIKDLKKL